MATRQNFTAPQRASAYEQNRLWLRDHRVDGVQLTPEGEAQRRLGRVLYCENCLFCSTDEERFDVDHFVPDKVFRDYGIHEEARRPVNMAVLCKSRRGHRGELGCNQTKGARLWVPHGRGLAWTRRDEDLNWTPVRERPFPFTAAR